VTLQPNFVMAALVPAIHVFSLREKMWMLGTFPGMYDQGPLHNRLPET